MLLEGVLLLRPPVADYLDYKVFLDVSVNEIRWRGRLRDAPRFGAGIMEKYETRYIPVYEKHLREDEPKKKADLVVDNNDFTRVLCKMPS